MGIYTAFSVLIVLAALFAYLNDRFLKLPAAIGLMALAIVTSLLLILVGLAYPPMIIGVKDFISSFDFSELLLGSMLSFMLFAGSLHINLNDLRQQRLSIIAFSTLSVIISTFIIGTVFYYLLPLFGIAAPFIYCLLFGSLISPTDPIAVLGILKEAGIQKSLETKIAGESLFNDGVAVVVFLTILHVAEQPGNLQVSDVALLFCREAFGGLILGLLLGKGGLGIMRSIDNYKVEVLITIAIVMGGYALASALHISGPLAMVAAGIVIGNHGNEKGLDNTTFQYISKFWDLIDETLNAILFVLIGLELLVINFIPLYLILGCIAIIVALITRYISLFFPAQLVSLKEKITQRTLFILTWGGLRGGISIALALSLKPEFEKDLWVSLTYLIVAFAILFQGLTIGKLAKKLKY